MVKWIAIAVIAIAVAIGLGAYFGDGDGPPWRNHDTEVVTTVDGQTIVIQDDGRGFPFPFLFVPFLILGLFWFAGGRRRGGGPWGDGVGTCEDAWREWHRREHESIATPPDVAQS